jgi:ubiquinone/menaquinone biosynthesis C-methylase UbiE
MPSDPSIDHKVILEWIPQGSTVLDLGCGTGKHSLFLASEGFQVHATDLAETGIKIAREKAKSLGISNIHFKQHDMREIPFADRFFDAVLCIWTIYHGTRDDIRKTVQEIYRVLKPDSTFLTDFLSVTDSTYGLGREIEKNTLSAPSKGKKTCRTTIPREKNLFNFSQSFGSLKSGQPEPEATT